MKRKKQCLFCHEFFYPDPRTYSIQKACHKSSCRKARKQKADKVWFKDNPDYSKSRQVKIRLWAANYPHYWQRYRKANPDYSERNRKQSRQRMQERRLLFAKQDAINANPVGYLQDIHCLKPQNMFAKQDTITHQLDGILVFLMAKEMFAKPDNIALSRSIRL